MNAVWLICLAGPLALALIALAIWRAMDLRHVHSAWTRLVAFDAGEYRTYDPALVAGLPAPAQRYFNYMIQPGTPILTVVEIDMTGELGLGSSDAPHYQTMRAHQVLAPPRGLIWRVRTGAIAGSDGILPECSWTRFWLFGLVPVARAGGPDHHRSAFGRMTAESVFWAPASLLPSDTVRWESVDEETARAIVQYGGFNQAVDISIDESGAPSKVVIQRWSNENADRQFREQPFGGYMSNFQAFGGYRLPRQVEGGNHINTPDYFPFYKACVKAIRFPEMSRLSQS